MPQTVDECERLLGPGMSLDCAERQAIGTHQTAQARSREVSKAVLLVCENTQCRVVHYAPHSQGSQPQRCPSCYGLAT